MKSSEELLGIERELLDKVEGFNQKIKEMTNGLAEMESYPFLNSLEVTPETSKIKTRLRALKSMVAAAAALEEYCVAIYNGYESMFK